MSVLGLGSDEPTNLQSQIGQFWNGVVLSLTAYHELQKEFFSSKVHKDAFLCCKLILKISCVFRTDTVLKYSHVLFQLIEKLALETELPLPAFKTQSIFVSMYPPRPLV